MSVNGPSAHALEGATEVIMKGARVSTNPKTMNGMERMNLVLRLSMAACKMGKTAQDCARSQSVVVTGLPHLVQLQVMDGAPGSCKWGRAAADQSCAGYWLTDLAWGSVGPAISLHSHSFSFLIFMVQLLFVRPAIVCTPC
jgi:hypothetical protein